MSEATTSRSINVFACSSLLSSKQQQKAARKSLFGAHTVLREGGWSYYDRESIEQAVISPVRVSDLAKAEEVALAFMQSANQKFAANGGVGDLFPLNKSLFKLKVAEQLIYKSGETPKAWKLTWAIFANPGTSANIPEGSGPWPHVSNSHISLVIELSGRILGGDASWRPITSTLSAKQLLSSTQIVEEISAARADTTTSAAGHTNSHSHDHGTDHTNTQSTETVSTTRTEPVLVMVYRNASPGEYRNYIDPQFFLMEAESGGHSHGPQLEIPATQYGICVNLLKSISSTTGEGEVKLQPWVVAAEGEINLAEAGSNYHVHWTVRRFGDPDLNNIQYYKSATALRLRGMYEVALTVRTEIGAIAHAHEFVCSSVGSSQNTPEQSELLV